MTKQNMFVLSEWKKFEGGKQVVSWLDDWNQSQLSIIQISITNQKFTFINLSTQNDLKIRSKVNEWIFLSWITHF